MQVCLSMCDLLVDTRYKKVNKRFGNKNLENVQILYVTYVKQFFTKNYTSDSNL